jgi:two-component SAPR family response regulator
MSWLQPAPPKRENYIVSLKEQLHVAFNLSKDLTAHQSGSICKKKKKKIRKKSTQPENIEVTCMQGFNIQKTENHISCNVHV